MNANESLTHFRVWFLLKFHTQMQSLVKSDALRANILGSTQTKGVPLQTLEVHTAHEGQGGTTENRQI